MTRSSDGGEPASPLRIVAYKPGPDRHTIGMQHLVCCEPLELEWLATYLDAHEVTLLDGMVDRRDPVRLADKLKAQVVLLTSFVNHVGATLALAARLKRLRPAPLVFVGGVHAEVCPEHFFCEAIDAVFFADQLKAIREVAARVSRQKSYQDVAGICLPTNAGWVRNDSAPLRPSELLPPRRQLLQAHPERYFYLHHAPCASLKTGFGCHESCNFCFCTAMHGGRFGPRPMADVLDELQGIECRNIYIVDDNFLSSARRVREFIAGVAQRGIDKRYIVYGDAAFVASHAELMADFARHGLVSVIVGFESIDDTELADMNKRARRQHNDRCVELCRRLDIELVPLFIVDPDWQPQQFAELARYVRTQELALPMFSTRTELPGTELTRGQIWAANTEWWRFDLLRLRQKPRHMSRLGYYLRLLYLYALPSLTGATTRLLRRRVGWRATLRLQMRAAWASLVFVYKLLRWR